MLPKKIFFFCIALLGVFGVSISSAYAGDPKLPINDDSYQAQYVSQTLKDPISLEVGETKTVDIVFKNIGSATWDGSSARYISAYTVEPKYRASQFHGSEWLSPKQTAKMQGIVPPGKTGTLSLTLTAPNKTGEYIERFYLAAENRTWMKGGYFYVKVNVVPKTVVDVSPKEEIISSEKKEQEDTASITTIQAKKVGQSKKSVSIAGGEQVSLVLIYQNIGTNPWSVFELGVLDNSKLASVNSYSFADKEWQSTKVVAAVSEAVPPQGFFRKKFTFRAPEKKGDYQVTFHLAKSGEMIEGSEAVVDIHVTSDAPDHYTAPVVDASSSYTAPTQKAYRLEAEPTIRVGLWKMQKGYVIFESKQDDYNIYTGDTYQGVLPVNTEATIKRVNGQYSLKAGDIHVKSAEYIRLEPKNNPHAVFTLLNYEREVSWKGPRNFNSYRGGMEYRLTDDGNENLYVINHLLFEDYVAGIAENSDSSPVEYLKAQATAQRTYAYYIATFSDKHEKRYFDVMATTADQLYLGYESERIMPNFVQAVEATRGYMVTYDVDNNVDTPNDVVITPYFGHTGGITNSWERVWGGHKPWLVPVKAEYDAKRWSSDYGHGVGMSQADAAMRAKEEGLSWEALVKYYYTGVAVEQLYK